MQRDERGDDHPAGMKDGRISDDGGAGGLAQARRLQDGQAVHQFRDHRAIDRPGLLRAPPLAVIGHGWLAGQGRQRLDDGGAEVAQRRAPRRGGRARQGANQGGEQLNASRRVPAHVLAREPLEPVAEVRGAEPGRGGG